MADSPPKENAADFKLSITRALADQLAEALEKLQPTPLTNEALQGLQSRPGVYELWLNGVRVYVGKASASLPTRLAKHRRKLSGRVGISDEEVEFICLYVDEDLDAAGPEKMLIKKYRSSESVPWNTNGFGNNDPGRRRDHSLVKRNHFDALFPINLDLEVTVSPPGPRQVSKFLAAAKKQLPYNLRYESKKYQSELSKSDLIVPDQALSARDIVRMALVQLPDDWQATALPGYIILYRDHDEYESASQFWRRASDGSVIEHAGAARLDDPGDIEEEPEDTNPED